MDKNAFTVILSIIALVLAGIITLRITMQKSIFDRTVDEALETSDGYDKKLIGMVNRLEDELVTRASFGYIGKKDPMTGRKRRVVLPQRIKRRPKVAKKPEIIKEIEVAPPEKPVIPEVDPVKLTAIIYDEEKRKYTAIVMDGERSFSVEVGDVVHGRKITKITNEMISMENEITRYMYDVFGKKSVIAKKPTG